MCSPPHPSRLGQVGDREKPTDPIHPPRRVHPRLDGRNLPTPRQTDLDRDRLWCKALITVLNVEQVSQVLVEFSRIRPD